MNITFTATPESFDFPLIIPIFEEEHLEKKFEKHASVILASGFSGKLGEQVSYLNNNHLVYLFGAGKKPTQDREVYLQKLGGRIAQFIKTFKKEKIAISCTALESFDSCIATPQVAFGVGLGLYSFDVYKSQKTTLPEQVFFFSNDEEKDTSDFEKLFCVMDGIYEARDLISEPANMLSPADFVEAVKQMNIKNATIKVLDKEQMQDLGMNLIVGVSSGAQNDPFLLVVEYMNGHLQDDPILLVGKGVCFDSGGMNLKPSQGLGKMKYDMAGGACVIGALWALSNMNVKKNVVAVVPLVENMLSGSAQHTEDVWRSMSGKTVEVGNTDAEGRLILADALWYGQENYNPKTIIDVATLTGVMKYVFADQYAGLFSNDDKLVQKLEEASSKTQDKIWRLPLNEAYGEMLKSPVADICNIGGNGSAGSATAGMFIQNFIQEGKSWAHLDIASVAWSEKEKPCIPVGATGFGVALLTQFILED